MSSETSKEARGHRREATAPPSPAELPVPAVTPTTKKQSLPPSVAAFFDELLLQLRTIAIPTASSFLLNRIPWLISLAFVGRIGPDELAAAALATTVCNVTGMSLGVGLSAALTTLTGQAVGELRSRGEEMGHEQRRAEYKEEEEENKDCEESSESSADEELLLLPKKGRKATYKSLSMDVDPESAHPRLRCDAYGPGKYRQEQEPLMPLAYLYRGIFVQLVLIIPIGIWWLIGVESNLLRLGQGDRISAMTANYLRVLTPGLWSYGLATTLNTWLQTAGMADVPFYVAAVVLALHVPFNILFIHVLGWGYLGTAAATATSQFLQPLLIGTYLFGTKGGRDRALDCTGARAAGYESLTFRREAYFAVSSLPGLAQYLSLGLPGIVVISEWWASEIAIFLAGRLQPNPSYALDGMTIYQSLNSFCFMLPVGMGVAGAARVGQQLGRGDGQGARLACRVSAIGAAFLSTVMGCVLHFTPHTFFPSIFTSDKDVIDEASKTISLLSVYVVADGVQFALGGAVKGCGRQCVLMPIVLAAYWIIGLPLGYYLSFIKHDGYMCEDDYFCGIRGLVGGMTAGTWAHMLLLAGTVVVGFDWREEARKARERLTAEKKQGSTPMACSERPGNHSSIE